MNVLYIGVDNPLTVSVNGYLPEQLSVSGCGAYYKENNGFWAKPTTPGFEKIYFKIDSSGVVLKGDFKIRRVPDPYIYCGNIKAGQLKLKDFQLVNSLIIKNPDFAFQLPYELVSFDFIYVPETGNRIIESTTGANFSQAMNVIKNQAIAGDFILINALIKMTDGRNLPVSTFYKLV